MEAAARLLSRHRISVAYKLVTTPRTTLMRPKDPLGPDEKSNVLYDLKCSKCPVHNVRERMDTNGCKSTGDNECLATAVSTTTDAKNDGIGNNGGRGDRIR